MAQRTSVQRPSGGGQGKICQFKLVLLGESAVGKSSLVLRFVKGQFHEYQESTIGAAFLTQTVCLDDTTVKFEIWDTAGQERYHSLAPMYYRGAQAAIVVYDITNQDTFGRAKTWVKELQRQASPNIVIALAGNKADLANKRMVEYEEAQTYAEENSLLFMETSAKTAMNVNDIFLAIAKKLPKSDNSATGSQREGMTLRPSDPTPGPAGCCKWSPSAQVEQCDASVSYNTQLLVAHFSPLDLKITTFLGSNFMHGSQLVKKDRLPSKINLVKPQLFNLCQVLRFRTITVKVLIISEYVICFLSKTLYVLGICESHGPLSAGPVRAHEFVEHAVIVM